MKRTDKETELKVIEFYKQGNSMAATGAQYGITAATVKRILAQNNIPSRTNGGIDKLPDIEIINKYKSGKTCAEIAKDYNVCLQTIVNVLDKNNISRDNIYHNLNLIENYWENIDSFDKAYFLGFMITDGNVYHNAITLELNVRDEDILHIFSKYTKNSNKILHYNRKSKGHFRAFCVKRLKWVNDLAKYGVVPNKTQITFFPEIPENLYPHLIRGMIDGDGWISLKGHQIGFCGSEKCVQGLRDFLVKTLNVFPAKILFTKSNICQVCWCSKKDMLKICEYIYKDKQDCFLQRKYNKYLELIHDNTEIIEEIKESSTL